jgi:hypothetical protein
MSRRSFSRPLLTEAFVKVYFRMVGLLEKIAKTFRAAPSIFHTAGFRLDEGAPGYRLLTSGLQSDFNDVGCSQFCPEWCAISDTTLYTYANTTAVRAARR